MSSHALHFVQCSLALTIAACGSGSSGPDEHTGSGDTGATGSTTGDSGDGGDGATTGDGDQAPTISGARLTPNPNNHLSVTIEFETDVAALASINVDNGGGHQFDVASQQGSVTSHIIDVVGLRAEESYGFEIVVRDEPGNTATDDSLAYATDPLPDDFPLTVAAESDPLKMSPGFTFFNVGRWSPLGPDGMWGLLLALDAEGRIVWYHREPGAVDVRPLPNGNLGFISGEADAREIDIMGREIAGWSAPAMMPPIDSIHHELYPFDDDTFLTLSSELRNIDGYDDGMGGTVAHDVVADVIVHFARDATVVDSWTLFDVLAPYVHRITIQSDFDGVFWNDTYMDEAPNGTKDWSHGNAVIYDPENDLLIVSLRHLDWIVAFERATGALAWRLGPDGDFTLDGDSWAYHPHAPQLQADGSLLIYDNGNGRPGTGFAPGDDPPYTRAVQFSLDTTTWVATETWSYTHDHPDNYAPFVGDADRLPNGNVLITDGGLISDPEKNIFDPTNVKFARLVEVTPDDPAEVVFELEIGDLVTGYTTYRADRVDALQP